MPGTYHSIHLHNDEELLVKVLADKEDPVLKFEVRGEGNNHSDITIFIDPQVLINKAIEAWGKYKAEKENELKQNGE